MADAMERLRSLRTNLPENTPENLNIREDLLLEARKLMLSLERQDNAVERVCFQVSGFHGPEPRETL
jgi:hypothetical protein